MGVLMKWLNSVPAQPAGTQIERHSIGELRERSLQVLADCGRPHDERIRFHLYKADSAQQIWLMRSEIYQAVARQHCEAEAARRVNGLLPMFEGWLPPGALTRIGESRHVPDFRPG